MARGDLLISLALAGSQQDDALFRETLQELIQQERAMQHHVLADRLEKVLTGDPDRRKSFDSRRASTDLVIESAPRRTLDELVLDPLARRQVVELVEEQQCADLLRAHGLEPRHLVMLVGPPGNGKTTLAEAIASELYAPFVRVRHEAVISSYLGETAERLQTVFNHVRSRSCVLLIDEFDALGKERGDEHEVGEVKRVVSALLQQIDDLPSYVVVIVATNHPELLDRAVWRRFQLSLELTAPRAPERERWFSRFYDQQGIGHCTPPGAVAAAFSGVSFAEIEEFCADVARRIVLHPETHRCEVLADRLTLWKSQFHPEQQGA